MPKSDFLYRQLEHHNRCAIFSEENLKLFDFKDDLVFYQIGGYGHDINWKMTKPLVEEMKMRFMNMRYFQKKFDFGYF